MNKSTRTTISKMNAALLCVLFAAGLSMSGCAISPYAPSEPQRMAADGGFAASAQVDGEKRAIPSQTEMSSDLATKKAAREDPLIYKGNDRMLADPKPRQGVTVAGEAVSLQFEQAPIVDVIHAIYGDILGLPYVITESVTGVVTIRTAKPIARSEVLPVIESLLAANGLAAVQDSSGVFHIGTAEALRDVAPAITLPGASVAGKRVVVVPLQYISASEMSEILQPVTRSDAILRVDGFRNLLILAGTSTQIEGWMEIVRLFDIDILKGMSVGLFPLEHLSVKEAEAALQLLANEPAGTSPQAASASRGQTTGGGRSAPQGSAPSSQAVVQGRSGPAQLGGPFAGVVRILPIERLNAILVVTSRSHYLDVIRDWIERVDVDRDNPAESKLFVYPVQNGSSAHLAALLSAVFGGRTVAGASGPQLSTGVAPGLRESTVSSAGASVALSQTKGSVPEATSSGIQTAPVAGVEIAPNVRVVADEQNNAILIYASTSEYRKIEAALRDLDKAPLQVLIEASIIEVTLNDELQYGLQWFFQGGVGGRYTGQGTLNLRSSGNIGPTQPGFSYTVTGPLGDVRAVLNALADKSLLKVISSPSVLVLDNQTAKIHVGDQQPILRATTISDSGNLTTSSVEYKDTGVQLSVTPSINAGGMVAMDVSQVVTDVGPVDAATGQRTFLQRFVSSKIAARSGETIVLGGLIRDNDTRGRQGVPVLHEVPVLGNLFGSTSKKKVRTELLVTLTPRILESEADLRAIGDELRNKMRGLAAFSENSRQKAGGGVNPTGEAAQ